MGLIEERHPTFKRLIGLWRGAQRDQLPPPAGALCREALGDLARVTIVLVPCEGSDMVIAESGVRVAGLNTTVLPQTSAGTIFQEGIAIGKFHGVMMPQTPSGCRTDMAHLSRSSDGSVWPVCRRPSPAMK